MSSIQPGRYDRERVARLKPIRTTIEALGLPLIRMRKLMGILNAIEMQIEDGGDSAVVNEHLLEALRAALLHQVGEQQAQPVFAAIDDFAQAEAARWQQVRAGTLPPIELTDAERLEEKVAEGYRLFEERSIAAACDEWLAAWEIAKQLHDPSMRSTEAFDDANPADLYLPINWCTELMMELHNAGLGDKRYVEKRLVFTREFLAHFPDEEAETQVEFYRGQGEALWRLGRRNEAETVWAEMVARFPDQAWGYIGWSDHYWWGKHASGDYARAESILEQALERPSLDFPEDVLNRLSDLYEAWGQDEKRAAVAARQQRLHQSQRPPFAAGLLSLLRKRAGKERDQPPSVSSHPDLGRNDPCWCGSGKKYKHCHLKADRKRG